MATKSEYTWRTSQISDSEFIFVVHEMPVATSENGFRMSHEIGRGVRSSRGLAKKAALEFIATKK